MAPAAIRFTHRRGRLHLASHQQIHEARFPHARLAHEHDGSRANEGAEARDTFGVFGGNHEHGHIARHSRNRITLLGKLGGIIHEVGLRENDRDVRLRLVGQHEFPLKARKVQLRERLRDSHDVEIRRHHLRHRALGRVATHKLRLARHDLFNLGDIPLGRGGNRHLVADDRPLVLAFDQRRCMLAAVEAPIARRDKGKAAIELHHFASNAALRQGAGHLIRRFHLRRFHPIRHQSWSSRFLR